MAKWLARRERQGWSWAELSRRSGVAVWTLRWWARRQAKPLASRRPAGAFVAVAVTEAAPPEPVAIEVVTAAGWRLRVGPGFDPEHLRQLLQALVPPC
jgi:hypothetical protein